MNVRSWWKLSSWKLLTDSLTYVQLVDAIRCKLLPVWPDAEIKRSPNFYKGCPKSSNSSFYFKSDVFQNSTKIHHKIGPLLKENLRPRPFEIAQSGHTGCYLQGRCACRSLGKCLVCFSKRIIPSHAVRTYDLSELQVIWPILWTQSDHKEQPLSRNVVNFLDSKTLES